jgi:hypothetical protein
MSTTYRIWSVAAVGAKNIEIAICPCMPLTLHEVPLYPFQHVSPDLFELNGENYLISVDSYSKWVSVDRLDSLTSSAVVAILDIQFAHFGIPERLFSDNGPQYSSVEFRDFTTRQGITHINSSPYFPLSNGLVEREVQTVKKCMVKMLEDGRSLGDILRAIRNTPIGNGLPTSSVLSQGRQLRTTLCISSEALLPQPPDTSSVRRILEERVGKQAFYNPVGNYGATPLLPGENVRVRRGNCWKPAQVVSHHSSPKSYLVKVEGGRVIRRNRSQINRTSENFETQLVRKPSHGAVVTQQGCQSRETVC